MLANIDERRHQFSRVGWTLKVMAEMFRERHRDLDSRDADHGGNASGANVTIVQLSTTRTICHMKMRTSTKNSWLNHF